MAFIALALVAAGCLGTVAEEEAGAAAAPPDRAPPAEGSEPATLSENASARPPNTSAEGMTIADTFHTPASHDCITDGIQFPVGLDRAGYYLPPGWWPEDRAQAARAVTDLPVPDVGQGSVTIAAWTCARHGFAGGPANLSSVMTWVKPPVFDSLQTPEAEIHLFLSEVATTNESIRRFYGRLGVRVTEADTERADEQGVVRDVVTGANGTLYSLEVQPLSQASAVSSVVWVSNEHGTGYVFQSVSPPEFGHAACAIAPGSHASYLVTNSACPPDTIGGVLDAAYENEFHWYRGLHPAGT